MAAFKGSKDALNWITNIRFTTTPYFDVGLKVQVHHGFYEAYNDVSQKFRDEVSSLMSQHPTARVLVTGHSLGAALATLCAVDFVRNVPGIKDKIDLYNFGCPRIGTPEWADYVRDILPGSNHFRVTHANDLVPHTPPQSIGFTHEGTEVWYKKDVTVDDLSHVVCGYAGNGQEEDSSCSDSNWLQTSVPNHLTYLKVKISNICDTYDSSPFLQ